MGEKWTLGPKWMPVCIRKRLPYAVEFRGPASVHDYLYKIGGTERKRRQADTLFLRMMWGVCAKLPIFRAIIGNPLAYVYYLLVRFGGSFSFTYFWKNR